MLWDLDMMEKMGDFDGGQALWDMMFEEGPWRKKGSKLNISKFMSITNRRRHLANKSTAMGYDYFVFCRRHCQAHAATPCL